MCKDVTLLTLKMEEEYMSQGIQAASGSWKKQANGLILPRTSGRNTCQF